MVQLSHFKLLRKMTYLLPVQYFPLLFAVIVGRFAGGMDSLSRTQLQFIFLKKMWSNIWCFIWEGALKELY
jgi:hypothetical protein